MLARLTLVTIAYRLKIVERYLAGDQTRTDRKQLEEKMDSVPRTTNSWIRLVKAANPEQLEALRTGKITPDALMIIVGTKKSKPSPKKEPADIVQEAPEDERTRRFRMCEQFVNNEIDRDRFEQAMDRFEQAMDLSKESKEACKEWVALYLKAHPKEKSEVLKGQAPLVAAVSIVILTIVLGFCMRKAWREDKEEANPKGG